MQLYPTKYHFTTMKKAAAIFFLLIFMLGNTAFGQLLKLPHLLEHFNTHRHENPGISFAGFLFLHYLADDGNPNDNAAEEQLPFKNVSPSIYSSFTAGSQQPYILRQPVMRQIIFFPAWQVSFYNLQSLSSLFRPPRS